MIKTIFMLYLRTIKTKIKPGVEHEKTDDDNGNRLIGCFWRNHCV